MHLGKNLKFSNQQLISVSPAPVKLISILVKSMIARCSMSVCSPSSAGSAWSSTVGVVKVPSTVRWSFVRRQMGKVQSWVHVCASFPTPDTCKGLSRLRWDAFLPLRPDSTAVRRTHGVPLKFPKDPGSISNACLPSASSVLLM